MRSRSAHAYDGMPVQRMHTCSTDACMQSLAVGEGLVANRCVAPEAHAVQVAVDISTPPEAFEAVDKAVSAFLKTQPTEFTGTRLVVANYAGDPLKYTLCVW